MDVEAKIIDLESKIAKERKCKDGAENMLKNLTDKSTIEICELELRESQRRLEFLEGEMRKLKLRRKTESESPSPVSDQGSSFQSMNNTEQTSGGEFPVESNYPYGKTSRSKQSSDFSSGPPTPAVGSMNSSLSTDKQSTLSPTTAKGQGNVFGFFGGLGGRPKTVAPTINRSPGSSNTSLNALNLESQIAISNFDFLKCETPITKEKVKFKLQEVKVKLEVEMKVKAGTERMSQAVKGSADMDKKREEEIEEKLKECIAKIAILHKTQQSYNNLWVGDDIDTNSQEGSDDETLDKEPIPAETSRYTRTQTVAKKQLTGKLKVRLIAAASLPGKKSFQTNITAVIRIDGVQKAKTRPQRQKWNEDFEIPVDRAQEVEIAIYEKTGTILALVWFKLHDLVEELRIRNRSSFAGAASSGSHPPVTMSRGRSSSMGNSAGTSFAEDDLSKSPIASHFGADGIETCLELEPSGQLFVRLNFTQDAPKIRRRNEGVFRRKPVQKWLPKRGHKFVPQHFYPVMKCAICQEFLISSQGYQCQLCKYTAHKKCLHRVITKCITKSDREETPDETDGESYNQLLNHRIPHRFEPTNQFTAYWCCHCGYMLPMSRRQTLKCTECSLACHKDCMPLVPHFCGLTPDLIDQMKLAIEEAERNRRDKEIMRSEQHKLQQEHLQQQEQLIKEQSEMYLKEQQKSKQQAESIAQPQTPPAKETKPVDEAPVDVTLVQKPKQPSTQPSKTHVSRSSMSVPPTSRPRNESAIYHEKAARTIGLDDFNFLAVLGKGNFGKVMLAEEKYSRALYAIKVLKKEFIIENDEVESTKSEKRVFLTANRERHPFLVNLHSCFQTESRIYFVMEYVSGGDLMWHIQHQQFSEKRAKFYACEVLLALEYFHKNNVVYRDLKLDNIMLTLEGHIKVADYGLCKENMGYGATTNTFCGTPEFMAPEILLEKPYTRTVDWWAFGVLIYEMLLGQSPFRGEDEEEIFEAILQDEILYPVNMAKDAVTILQRLLTKDPTKRLGYGRGDADDVKKHPFFRGVDWDAMAKLQVPPPFYPKISSPTDVSNFDEEFTREMPVLTPCNSVLSAADQEQFRGFTYVSEWAQTARLQALAQLSGTHHQ